MGGQRPVKGVFMAKTEKSEKTSHDQTFKTVIREFFKEFMELFLPAEAKRIDFK